MIRRRWQGPNRPRNRMRRWTVQPRGRARTWRRGKYWRRAR